MAKRKAKDDSVVTYLMVGGSEFAILPRADLDRLRAAATIDEDAGTKRIIDRSKKALAEGREILIPSVVADRIADGENAIKVLREWRGMTQRELALNAGISQNYLSMMERGEREGRTDTRKSIAEALNVPLDLLI